MHGKARPRVGLLSNGTEEHKGTILTREAHKLLLRARREGAEAGGQAPGFEYVGYVEGRDIFDGELDVVVTDGFTGNVMLKSLEGLVEAIFHLLREEVGRRGPLAKLGAWLMRPALRGFKHRTDYAETGGAPLLGVAGVPMICHGGSDARAIKNALHEAGALADLDLAEALTRAMAAHAHIWEEAAASPTNERLPS
jgi:glycerol-3-phosphate acyltransferase PlsX